MKIREGAYYRTRGGDVVGPMCHQDTLAIYPWATIKDQWTISGRFSANSDSPLDLISEVYVSDTPLADAAPAAAPSDDTVITLNFSAMARDGSNWTAGSIGFWIGGEMRMAHYDVRIEGKESNAWPSDVPNPWRDKRRLPAPAQETKTLRDEFAMVAVASCAVGPQTYRDAEFPETAAAAYAFADAMMEARKK